MDPRHNLGDSCFNCMFLTCLVISFKGIVLNIIPNKSLIYFIEITNKISSFKTSFKKNGFSCKKRFERSICWVIEIMHGFFDEVYAKRISWPKLHWFDWMKHIIHNTFFTESEFTGLGKSSPSILVNNITPPENVFFTTYRPSPTLWSNQWLLR